MGSSGTLPASGATPEELQRRIADLVEAVAARDTFIAIAAHELRNPMTPMMGHVDLLLQGLRAGKYSPEQIAQRLERIRHVMSHYVKRATVLLNVARITSGKLMLEPVACDLADLVRSVAGTFAEPAHHAGSPIGIDAPPTFLAPGIHWQWSRSSTISSPTRLSMVVPARLTSVSRLSATPSVFRFAIMDRAFLPRAVRASSLASSAQLEPRRAAAASGLGYGSSASSSRQWRV